MSNGWRVMSNRWRVMSNRWRVMSGGWRVESEKWRVCYRRLLPVLPVLLFAGLLTACRQTAPLAELNAVYYWRTELRLNDAERQFLDRHHIRRVYCRYFDVVMDDGAAMPHPNATLTFTDPLPEGIELVPTVYITEDCMHQRHDSLARMVVRRILQMNATNGISGVTELQMDCDYTARSRQNFYDFLSEVKAEISNLNSQTSNLNSQITTLSATIRLHQLQMEVPPVDYGVLMLYNTGDPRRFHERNPILDERDVQPYVRHLADYALPLAAAYPVYRWQRQVEGLSIEHTVEDSVILNVKRMVETERPSLANTIITYHLDEENINRYSTQTYEAIYHH